MDEVIRKMFEEQKWTLVEGKRTYFHRHTGTHIIELTDMMDMRLPETADEECLMTIIDAEDGKLFKQLTIPSLRWLVERRKDEPNRTH